MSSNSKLPHTIFSAIDIALANKNQECVLLLLTHEDIELDLFKLLSLSIQYNWPKVIEQLMLCKNFNVNIEDNYNKHPMDYFSIPLICTPLHLAFTSKDREECALKLLESQNISSGG